MPSLRTGGCICGGVRYAAPEPLRPINTCHCRECRQMAGGPSSFTACAAAGFAFERGEDLVRWFAGPTSATGGVRGFCSACGTYLAFRIPDDPLLYFSATTLDDESGLQVEAHIFWDRRAPWEAPDGLPTVDGYGAEGLGALYGEA
jgi:hypothetical protein